MEEQKPITRDAAIRLTMLPRDTNAHGTVFGGVILSYIDVAGGVESVRYTKHNRFVTVAMKEVIFHEPSLSETLSAFTLGLSMSARLRSRYMSMSRLHVWNSGRRGESNRGEVTFVAIDETGKKIQIAK
jgi:acyl-CoA thioesterase YciA